MQPGALLLVHPGALGDVLITLGPASRVPSPLWVAARGAVLRLGPWVPSVERWFDLDGACGPALLGHRASAWPTDLAPVRAALVLRRDTDDGEVAERLSGALGAPVVVASAFPQDRWSAHRHVARLLGVSPEPMERPWIAMRPVAVERSSVVVHPGSGGRAKRWSLGAFAETAAILSAQGAHVIWILGEAELDDGMDRALVGEVRRAPPLEDVAGALARAAAYLGNDSGVSHLAAAVGTPAVLVFGPTSPLTWAPAARWVTAVRGNPSGEGTRWGLDPARIADRVLAAMRG